MSKDLKRIPRQTTHAKLNFCLLFANYYLHYRKVNEKNIDWVEFTAKVNYKLRIENQVSGSLL